LLLAFPAQRRGYVYLILSLTAALVLGIAILGTATFVQPVVPRIVNISAG
jgi:hypothetical protein